mmetsp:Transcript_6494/g.18185  ORF Transcript_6494/g.18185 Transcript_6494/m.18185 type:complete len:266 (-) Transcript_6494:478-1275(-)
MASSTLPAARSGSDVLRPWKLGGLARQNKQRGLLPLELDARHGCLLRGHRHEIERRQPRVNRLIAFVDILFANAPELSRCQKHGSQTLRLLYRQWRHCAEPAAETVGCPQHFADACKETLLCRRRDFNVEHEAEALDKLPQCFLHLGRKRRFSKVPLQKMPELYHGVGREAPNLSFCTGELCSQFLVLALLQPQAQHLVRNLLHHGRTTFLFQDVVVVSRFSANQTEAPRGQRRGAGGQCPLRVLPRHFLQLPFGRTIPELLQNL